MFDVKKIVYNQEEPSYRVKYFVYKDSTPYTEHFTEEAMKHKDLRRERNNNTACFSQLSSMLYSFSKEYEEWPNRLLFLCNFEHHKEVLNRVKYDEIVWWTTICKKYKLLPEYIGTEFAKTGNFILKISTLDLNTLYIYLSAARYLQEAPYFVKVIKYLVEDIDMDFYIAFAVASRCCMCGHGHHIIPVSKQYPYASEKHNSVDNVDTYTLNEMISLRKFLAGEKGVKKKTLNDIKPGDLVGRFNLHTTFSKMKIKPLVVTRKELLSKDIIRKVYGEIDY